MSALIRSEPSAPPRSLGDICLFGPVPIHELTVSPCPFCWNCLSRSFKPPLSTLPAAPPASSPPSPPRNRSPIPPRLSGALPLGTLALLLGTLTLIVFPSGGTRVFAGAADG